jgi:hypothetical protein
MSETAVQEFPITDEMVREGCRISYDFMSASSQARREEVVKLILHAGLTARPIVGTGVAADLVQRADDAVRAFMSEGSSDGHRNRTKMTDAIEGLQVTISNYRNSGSVGSEAVHAGKAFDTQAIVERLRKRATFFRFDQTAGLLREAADIIQSQTVALTQKRRATGGARTMEALTNAKGLLQAFTGPNDAIAQTAISEIDAVLGEFAEIGDPNHVE